MPPLFYPQNFGCIKSKGKDSSLQVPPSPTRPIPRDHWTMSCWAADRRKERSCEKRDGQQLGAKSRSNKKFCPAFSLRAAVLPIDPPKKSRAIKPSGLTIVRSFVLRLQTDGSGWVTTDKRYVHVIPTEIIISPVCLGQPELYTCHIFGSR